MPVMEKRIHLYRSNRVENLAAALADILRQPAGEPLEREAVVIHSSGLERWIKMQVAQRLGICANVEFIYPHVLLARLMEAVTAGEADLEAWSAERLVWGVLASLPGLLPTPAFAAVRAYLDAGKDMDRGRRTWELAHQIAVHFNRYSAYRPLLVWRWEQGEEDSWEAALWRELAGRSPAARAASTAHLLDELCGDEADLEGIPARINVFSVVTLPPLSVHVLGALARHREVNVFVLSPSPAWWDAWSARDDLEIDDALMPPRNDFTTGTAGSNNPLLASMGNLARDFQVALKGVPGGHDEPGPDLQVEPADDTLLGAVQADIYHSRTPTVRPLVLGDDTIRVHACHGELRQVQVLRDELLRLFDELPDLEPRDVLVMAPDVEVFAPLVEAVFSDGADDIKDVGEHPGGYVQIPHALADRGVAAENPAAAALLAVLDLVDSRLSATAVLDLLAMPPVCGGFGITTDDLPKVRKWVAGAGIRWAADADHRQRVGQPTDEQYTWRLGLDRLMAGAVMGEQDLPVLDLLPHGGVEGKEDRALLGTFVDFCEKLLTVREVVGEAAGLETWRDRLFSILDDLVPCTHRTTWQARQVRDGVNEMLEAARDAGFDVELDLLAVRAMLAGRFLLGEAGDGFVSGRVTFCQLTPMRSIPFRVVCLLGMDDQAFPRTKDRLGFDLMAQEPLLGDRNVREDNRALFLEALLSARDRLVICYTGRRARDHVVCPPAVPVDELLDVIDQTAPTDGDGRCARDRMVVQHPLQPFSPNNFDGSKGGAGPLGHDRRQLGAARRWIEARQGEVSVPGLFADGQPLDLPVELEREVDVDLLARFFQHPIQALLTRRLRIWLPEVDDPVADREPVKLDSLEKWSARDQLLTWRLSPDTDLRQELDRRMAMAARLQLGNPGERELRELLDEVEALAGRVEQSREGDALLPVDLDLVVRGTRGGDTLVTGRIADIWESGRVAYRAGKAEGKYELDLWIRHLALSASGWEGASRLQGTAGSEAGFGPLALEDAADLLRQLLDLYWMGQQYPLLFFPRCSWTFKAQRFYCRKDADPERSAFERLMSQRYGWGAYGEPGPYGELVLGERCPYDPYADLSGLPVPEGLGAAELAEQIWEPVRLNRKT